MLKKCFGIIFLCLSSNTLKGTDCLNALLREEFRNLQKAQIKLVIRRFSYPILEALLDRQPNIGKSNATLSSPQETDLSALLSFLDYNSEKLHISFSNWLEKYSTASTSLQKEYFIIIYFHILLLLRYPRACYFYKIKLIFHL
jgi:hypothetical protein